MSSTIAEYPSHPTSVKSINGKRINLIHSIRHKTTGLWGQWKYVPASACFPTILFLQAF